MKGCLSLSIEKTLQEHECCSTAVDAGIYSLEVLHVQQVLCLRPLTAIQHLPFAYKKVLPLLPAPNFTNKALPLDHLQSTGLECACWMVALALA